MLRLLGKITLWICAALAVLAALTYLGDDLYARRRGIPTDTLRVDRFYAARNRWNEIEYSLGTPAEETCIEALLPHFGYLPCWYLRRHTIRQIGNP